MASANDITIKVDLTSECQKELIKMVKSAGLYLQANSEDIVGKLGLRAGMNISIDFCDYDGMLYRTPKIEINHKHFVPSED